MLGLSYLLILDDNNEQVLDKEAFQKQMLEKLIWISAFMLVGARHPGASVGVVEKEYRSEVRLSFREDSYAKFGLHNQNHLRNAFYFYFTYLDCASVLSNRPMNFPCLLA